MYYENSSESGPARIEQHCLSTFTGGPGLAGARPTACRYCTPNREEGLCGANPTPPPGIAGCRILVRRDAARATHWGLGRCLAKTEGIGCITLSTDHQARACSPSVAIPRRLYIPKYLNAHLNPVLAAPRRPCPYTAATGQLAWAACSLTRSPSRISVS